MAASKDTYRTVTPYLVVPDADAELAFLKAAFGATEANCHRGPDNTVMHAEVRIGDSLVMLGQAGGPWKPRPAALYLWVEDVDATTHARFKRERRPKRTRRQAVRASKRRGRRSERRDVVDWRSGQVETEKCHRAIASPWRDSRAARRGSSVRVRPDAASFLADGAESKDRYSVSIWRVAPHSAGPGAHCHRPTRNCSM